MERPLERSLVEDCGFQRSYPVEVGLLAEAETSGVLAVPVRYETDGAGRIITAIQRAADGTMLGRLLETRPDGFGAEVGTLVALDLLTALAALHKLGLAHRLVDAGRIVVTAAGMCVLIDPCLAPRADGGTAHDAIRADLSAAERVIERCLGSVPLSQGPLVTHNGSASEMLLELGSAATERFDAGWAARARAYLAEASTARFGGAAQVPPAPVPEVDTATHRRPLRLGEAGGGSRRKPPARNGRLAVAGVLVASATFTVFHSNAATVTKPATVATAVTSTSITEFAYVGMESERAQAIVRVQTNGTGPVVLTLSFTGSDVQGVAGSSERLVHTFKLEGKHSYTVTDTVDGAHYCYTKYWDVMVGTSFRQLAAPSC